MRPACKGQRCPDKCRDSKPLCRHRLAGCRCPLPAIGPAAGWPDTSTAWTVGWSCHLCWSKEHVHRVPPRQHRCSFRACPEFPCGTMRSELNADALFHVQSVAAASAVPQRLDVPPGPECRFPQAVPFGFHNSHSSHHSHGIYGKNGKYVFSFNQVTLLAVLQSAFSIGQSVSVASSHRQTRPRPFPSPAARRPRVPPSGLRPGSHAFLCRWSVHRLPVC